MTRDHNLLFGVFAVQLGKVTPVQLMDAAAAWAADTSRDIPSRLVALGILSEPDRDLLQRFVDEAVAAHGGNAERTLANFGGEEQVHRTFRGSIVLTADGQVSIPPTQPTPTDGRIDSDGVDDVSKIKGVFETPGRYTELREYARGGMGRVLLVHDDSLGREIALKELLPHLGEIEHQSTVNAEDGPGGMHPSPVRFSAHILARFLQEARITGQLEHPGIVPVYELGHRRDGTLYYTMKLVRGRSLSKALKECKNLEERLRYLPHFVDLCQAIAYAHSRGIIHRDIKPANVMVGEFGETVVLDWGLAKKKDRADVHEGDIADTILAMNLGDEVAAARTAFGQILGTPVYMAPEQARGDLDAVNEQSDVYALGVVLYEILTGKVPFEGKSTREVLDKVIAGDLRKVRSIEPRCPKELAAIEARAMSSKPEGRYRTANDLAEDVANFQSGQKVRAYRYGIAERSMRLLTRHAAVTMLGLGALGVLVVLSAIYIQVISTTNHKLAMANALAEERAYAASSKSIDVYIDKGHIQMARRDLDDQPHHLLGWEWGHLLSKLPTPRFVLPPMCEIQGPWLATAFSGEALLFDRYGGKEMHRLKIDGKPFYSLVGQLDGNLFACNYTNDAKEKRTLIWQVDAGSILQDFNGTTVGWTSGGRDVLIYEPEYRHNEKADHWTRASWTLRVLETTSGNEIFSFGHPEFANFVPFQGNGSASQRYLLLQSSDRGLSVFDFEAGKVAREFALDSNLQVTGPVVSQGGLVAVGCFGKVLLINMNGTAAPLELLSHPVGTHYLSFSQDGRWLAVVPNSRLKGIVFDTETGRPVLESPDQPEYVSEMTFSQDGTLVATASEKMVQILNVPSGELVHTTAFAQGETHTQTEVDWEHEQIIARSPFNTRLWSLREDVAGPKWADSPGMHIDGVAFSENEKYLIVSGRELESHKQYADVWDWRLASRLYRFHLGDSARDTKAPKALAVFRPNAGLEPTQLLTLTAEGGLQLRRFPEGDIVRQYDSRESRIYRASFSGDGHRIVTASWDGTARVIETDSGKLLTIMADVHSADLQDAQFSPDGKFVATAGDDRIIALWRSDDGSVVWKRVGHNEWVTRVCFSPDGTRLVSVAWDGTAKIWDLKSGDVLQELLGHGGPIEGVSFSPDSERIATASQDKTANVWSSASGISLLNLDDASDGIDSVAFSPSGENIVFGDRNGAIWRYDSRSWNKKDWFNPAKAAQMIEEAKRLPASYSTGEFKGLDEARGLLLVLGQVKKLQHTDSHRFLKYTPGQGIMITNLRVFNSILGDIGISEGELLYRLNGLEAPAPAIVYDEFTRFFAEGQRFLAGEISVPPELTAEFLSFNNRWIIHWSYGRSQQR